MCHNPTHWFKGTNQENIDDRNRKDRGGRKITIEIARQIKMRLRYESQQKIADDLRIHQTLVSAIKRGVVWKHVSC